MRVSDALERVIMGLEQAVREEQVALATSPADDHAEYMRRVGVCQGMDKAVGRFRDEIARMEEDDDF